MSGKERLEAYLAREQVPFVVHDHEVAYTAQQVASAEHIPGRFVAKSVIVMAGDQLAMFVLPAVLHVDLDQAARVAGVSEARLASEAQFAHAFPDCELGAIPPFANLYDLPVYVDRTLAEDDRIVFPAGTHTSSISVPYADFDRLVRPIMADFRTDAQPASS